MLGYALKMHLASFVASIAYVGYILEAMIHTEIEGFLKQLILFCEDFIFPSIIKKNHKVF